MVLAQRHRVRLCAVVGLLVISVAGCSKTNDSSTSTGGTPPASLVGKVNDHGTDDLTGAGSAPTVDMELDDNYFGPTYLEVAPGATIKVSLKNEGSRQHTITTADGVDVAVDPGQTGEAELTAPASGQLAFYCRFHEKVGMQGAVVVGTSGGASPSSPPSVASTTTRASAGGYGY